MGGGADRRPCRREMAVVDALKASTLPRVLEDVDAAYYSLQSLHAGTGFHGMNLRAARAFSHVAWRACAQERALRIIHRTSCGMGTQYVR